MRRAILFVVFVLCAPAAWLPGNLYSQQNKAAEKGGSLTSEQLDNEGRELDKQIAELSGKIGDVIAKGNLINNKDIRILPYQISYRLGDAFIELEKHSFERNELLDKIVHLRKKSVKVFMSGQSVARIESVIYEKDYESGVTTEVRILDPSPGAPGTDDIVFTHLLNNKKLLDAKKLAEIKNTTAFPVRNDLKRDFYVPHLSYFYSVILNVSETYSKSIKDADTMMSEFLKKSRDY